MADQENLTALLSGNGLSSRKARKPPPVTPKRFNKFFAPRSSASHGCKQSLSKSGRQLRDMTQSGLNRRAGQLAPRRTPKKSVVFEDATNTTPPSKKRKLYLTPDSSPPRSSPCKNPLSSDDIANMTIPSSPPQFLEYDDMLYRSPSPESRAPPLPIRRVKTSGMATRILQRSFGGLDGIGRGRRKDNCSYWQAQATNFYSKPEDVHAFAHPSLPFSTASCNTNTLIATGDESGSVRIIETADNSEHGFAATYLTFQPHSNAVMDLAFSSDDSMLATASGDQTAKITDMRTQKTKYIMHEHTTSVKQVRFQPGNDNILATSSRDGSVQIWDMRCHGDKVLVSETRRPTSLTSADQLSVTYQAIASATYNTILGAHADRQALHLDANQRDSGAKDATQWPNARTGSISVTSLAFLSSPGRSHLLLTGSEASATLKLWDIRNRYSRHKTPTPLSTTRQPESHSRHRNFGVTSIVLGQNDSRIYALSRDNTIYAYSTAHLILGHAPELSSSFAEKNMRSNNDGRAGLGPIYGFRHPMLHATSFYVKASLRKATDNKPEMLAVGSSEGCPILFPTDESFLNRSISEHRANLNGDYDDEAPQFSREQSSPMQFTTSSRLSRTTRHNTPPDSSPASVQALRKPALRRVSSGTSLAMRMRDTIPIYGGIGTPLVGGHNREVTALCWTHNGSLISLGDDYTARCWREGPEAKTIRRADFKHEKAGWGLAMDESTWDEDDG